MDLISSSKAAGYGSIWNTPAVQRARNSHVPAHVGHQRNTFTTRPHLWRLDSVGEVSSEKDQVRISPTNMTPKISVSESTPGKSKIMKSFANWFPPVGNSVFNFGKNIGSCALVGDTRRLPQTYNTALCDLFCEQKDTVSTSFNRGYHSLKGNSSAEMFSTFHPAYSQNSVLMNVCSNHDLLNTSTLKELSSPWNKFYAEWKKTNSDRGQNMDPVCSSSPSKPGNDQTSFVPDLVRSLQCLSVNENDKLCAEKSDSGKKTESKQTKLTQNTLIQKRTICDQNIDRGRSPTSSDFKVHMKQQNKMNSNSNSDTVDTGTCNCQMKNISVPEDANCLQHRKLKRFHCDHHSMNCAEVSKNGMCLKQGKMEIMNTASKDHVDTDSAHKRKPKRTRPSSKKRRRLKARQLGSSSSLLKATETQRNTGATSGDSSKSFCNPVSFILGINELESDKSFKVSVLLDDESVFSDNEDDCDTTFQCDFLPHCGDLFNPLNFTLSISLSSSTPETCPMSPFHDSAQIDAINASWQLPESAPPTSTCTSKTCKKVRFAPDEKLQAVYPMIAWSYAYQAARKGPWEEYARDRQRFQRRITESEELLGSVFKPCHRIEAYNRQISSKYA